MFPAHACDVYQDGELDATSCRDLPFIMELEHGDRIPLSETSTQVLKTHC